MEQKKIKTQQNKIPTASGSGSTNATKKLAIKSVKKKKVKPIEKNNEQGTSDL